jgi:hypothetical protein
MTYNQRLMRWRGVRATILPQRRTLSSKAKHKIQCGLMNNTIIREGATIFELHSCEHQALLSRWNAMRVLNFLFDLSNSVARIDANGDCLACRSKSNEF